MAQTSLAGWDDQPKMKGVGVTNEVQGILEAVADAVECTLASFRLMQEHVYGEGVIHAYELHLTTGDGETVSQVVYLETSPGDGEREGIPVFRDSETGDEVAVWLYPTDPALPALPTAVFPEAVGVILQKMGVDPKEIRLHLLAYRPGKRAVVKVDTEYATTYLKVVRPKTIEDLQAKYSLWREHGLPVPGTIGWSQEGLIGFTALTGVPALDAVEQLGASFIRATVALMRQYAEIPSESGARASLASRRDWYVRRVTREHPELGERIERLDTRIGELLDGAQVPEPSTIHGDLHLGQLFFTPGEPDVITGVLDIDTAGLGDPADDYAAMLAHLIVTAEFERAHERGRANEYERVAQEWREHVKTSADETDSDLLRRTDAIAATHILAHALGGHVPADTLLGRAETLLELT